MASTAAEHGFLGMITAETSLLLRRSDENAITQRLSSVAFGGLLVSCSFASTTDALCWLTNPVATEAVLASKRQLSAECASMASDLGWLAVVSPCSSFCLRVDKSGFHGPAVRLRQAAPSVCVAARFGAAVEAHRWSGGAAVQNLIEVLRETAGVSPSVLAVWAVSERRRMSRAGQLFGEDVVSLPSKKVESDSLSSVADPSASLSCAADHPLAPTPMAPLVHVAPDSLVPVVPSIPALKADQELSPFAVWAAKEMAAEGDRPASPRQRLGVGVTPPSGQRRQPSGDARGETGTPIASSRSAGSGASTSRFSHILATINAPSFGNRSTDPPCSCEWSTAGAGQSPSGACGRARSKSGLTSKSSCRSSCSCKKPTKLMRLDETDGLPAALNPPGHGRGGRAPILSREEVTQFRAYVGSFDDVNVETAQRSPPLTRTCGGAQVGYTGVRRCRSPPPRSTSSQAMHTRSATAGPATNLMMPDAVVVVDDPSVEEHTSAICQRSTLPASSPRVAPLPSVDRVARQGPLGQLSMMENWAALSSTLAARGRSTFVTGGAGVGKSTFLRAFRASSKKQWPGAGNVATVAPSENADKTAGGQTYHSFFGFPRAYKAECKDSAAEATRMMSQRRFSSISRRLTAVRALLLDEISMVAADRLDVMVELLRLSRPPSAPACVVYAHGDFLQFGPTCCELAITAKCWPVFFGDRMLELTRVHRQHQPEFVSAVQDAMMGRCTLAVEALMEERKVSQDQYEALKCTVLHVMPRHEDVEAHNSGCLSALCGAASPLYAFANDTVVVDKDADVPPTVDVGLVPDASRDAALFDCVAPRRVPHCRGARVMLTTNVHLALGLHHGSIGVVSGYTVSSAAIVRFEGIGLPAGYKRGTHGVHDAGDLWLEIECAPVKHEAKILAYPGMLAERHQVPFVLGWGISVGGSAHSLFQVTSW